MRTLSPSQAQQVSGGFSIAAPVGVRKPRQEMLPLDGGATSGPAQASHLEQTLPRFHSDGQSELSIAPFDPSAGQGHSPAATTATTSTISSGSANAVALNQLGVHAPMSPRWRGAVLFD